MSGILNPRATSPEVEQITRTLRENVVGQIEAVDELVRCYMRFRAGLAPQNRPMGVFMLAGPTGVGKTYLAEEFARAIGHAPASILKVDCGEFKNQHEIARLVGAPPGYLGHRETMPVFTQQKLTAQHTDLAPMSIVLFDEMEKAHPALHDMMLGILDKGILHLGDGNKVHFTNSLILMTTNLGASTISNALAPKWGLAASAAPADVAEPSHSQLSHMTEAAAAKVLRPEFVNRVDKILTFHALSPADMEKILELQLDMLADRLLVSSTPIGVNLTPEAKAFVLNAGYEQKYGARHLKRSIAKHLEEPLANIIVSRQVSPKDVVKVGVKNNELEFVLL